tara:strand:+ start:1175 stop:1909 length:735 start_codon:yes stop_codon:yes gene_type:complete
MNRQTLTRLLALALLLLGGLSERSSADDQTCLRFGVQDLPVHRLVAATISEALTQGDICHSLVYLPPRRITRELLSGSIDGELLRYPFYAEIVQDIAAPVPEKLFELQGFLVSPDPDLQTLEQIGNRPVGILLGNSWAEHEQRNLTNPVTATSAARLLDMLEGKRTVGVLLNSAEWGALKVHHPQLHATPVRALPVYIYLAKRHSVWMAPIADAIRKHKETGGSFLPSPGDSGKVPGDRIAYVF